MNKQHMIITTIAATAAAITLTACSSGTSSSHASTGDSSGRGGGMTMSSTAPSGSTGNPASGPHNSADVGFATDMIPHHRQAVQMADMALSKATNAQVKSLAATIKSDQDPEIAAMSGWLTGWGRAIPTSSMGSSMGSMGGMSMPGMMSDTDMAALHKASGAAFNRMWVQMMTAHHQGALTMARTELTKGQNPDARSLAKSIISSQSKQIQQLKTLLSTLPAN